MTRLKPDLIISVERDPEFIAGQLRKPSGEFAKKIGFQMNKFNKSLYDFVFDLMELKEFENILEIGFGNGMHFGELFSRAKNLVIKGIEYSPEMLREGNLNNRSLISEGKLELYSGSSDELPFADNYFDKVFCNMVIYFWQQPEKHLSEIRRVLKPGGKFYAGLRTKESTLTFSFAKYGFVFYEPGEWNSILDESGFAFTGKFRKLEKPVRYNGQDIRLESICYVGRKKT